MLPTEAAELRELQPLGRLLLVLRRRVIAPLALEAGERHDVSHGCDPVGILDWGFGIRESRTTNPDECLIPNPKIPTLLDDLRDRSRADGAAALADGEPRALFEGDGRHQLAADRRVVARHHHLDAFRQVQRPGHVGGADVELRAVAVEERRVTAALFLRQDVDLALELRVRLDAARLGQHLPALDVVFFHAAEQDADVVARLARIQDLAEHFDAGDDLLLGRLEPDDLHFLADLHPAALDTPR